MSKLNNVWVIAPEESAVAELASAACELGENVTLVFAGDRAAARGANTAYRIDTEGKSFAALAASVADFVAEERPDLVISGTSKDARLVAACIAQRWETCVLTDVSELDVVDGGVRSKRMVYGGAAFKTEKASLPAVACVAPGAFPVVELPEVGDVAEAPVAADDRIALVGKMEKEVCGVNLAAAKYVVGVGRGLGTEENLELAKGLADAMGAGVGCTRPIAEEEGWMPRETYIGVSGLMIKPDVFVSVGISGQIQHSVGVSQSKKIFAINKDKNAPVFKQCDYGIVADLAEVLPVLTKLI